MGPAPGLPLLDPSGELNDRNWHLATTGNFEPNGFTDLVFRHALSGENRLWAWRGGGMIPQAIPSQEDIWWTIEGTGDFDDDGYEDLFWRHRKHGYTDIWFNLGGQWSPSGNTAARALEWRFVNADDLNGDGFDDIVWCHQQTGQVEVWLMVEDEARWTWHIPAIAHLAPILEAVVDLNHDGHFDFVWYSRRFNWYFASLMSQDTITATSWIQPLPAGSGMELEQVGDYDGDQRTDLLFRRTISGVTEAWRMDGFTATERLSMGSVPATYSIPGSGYHRNEQQRVSLSEAAEIMRQHLNLIEDPALKPLPTLHFLPAILHEGTTIQFPLEPSFNQALPADAFLFVLDRTPYVLPGRDGMDGAFLEVYAVDPLNGQVTAVAEGPSMPHADGFSILSEGLLSPEDLVAFPNDLNLSEPDIQVTTLKADEFLQKRARQPIRKTWVFGLVDSTEKLFVDDFNQVTGAMEHYLKKRERVPATVFRDGTRDSFTKTVTTAKKYINCCDHVVIYASAHGIDSSRGPFAISVPDKHQKKPKMVALDADYFINLLKGIKARTVTIVLDACYAEGLAKDIGDKIKANSGKGKPFGHITHFVTLASQEATRVGFGTNDDSDFSGKFSELLKKAKVDFRTFTYKGELVVLSGSILQKSVTQTVIDREDDVDCGCQEAIDSYRPVNPDGCRTRLSFVNQTPRLVFANGREYQLRFYAHGDPIATNKRFRRVQLKSGQSITLDAHESIKNVRLFSFASVRRRTVNDFQHENNFFRYHRTQFFDPEGLLDVPCGVKKIVTFKQDANGYVFMDIQQIPFTY